MSHTRHEPNHQRPQVLTLVRNLVTRSLSTAVVKRAGQTPVAPVVKPVS